VADDSSTTIRERLVCLVVHHVDAAAQRCRLLGDDVIPEAGLAVLLEELLHYGAASTCAGFLTCTATRRAPAIRLDAIAPSTTRSTLGWGVTDIAYVTTR